MHQARMVATGVVAVRRWMSPRSETPVGAEEVVVEQVATEAMWL
jgi:hypothetical protein